MADTDKRCLEHDHHFDERELYDQFSGEPLDGQLKVKCMRCGMSMEQSLLAMLAECRQLAEGKLH